MTRAQATARHTADHVDRVPIVIVVPDDHGLGALGDIPGIEIVVWDLAAPIPDAARSARVLVTRVMEPAQVVPQLDHLPQLRVVQLFSAGRDAWLDFVPAGVEVSGADDVHGGTVAEWVVAQLLSHHRDLDGYRARQRLHVWERHFTGTLAGKQVLVLGAGDIGRNVTSRLEPFGAAVTMAARSARDGVIDFAQARAALSSFDVVVLALPLTSETENLVDASFLADMKDHSVLVNVGRGPLVDTDALLEELTARRLHAILDVTNPEPLPSDHPLWDAPGAVITPHSAAITADTLDRCWRAIARKVRAFVQAGHSVSD